MSRRNNRRSANRPSESNQLRIIGGKWRSRKLSFPSVEGLRPTGDRVRETLFNWLNFSLPGAHCLDLFAGSGALGLEALSRGASEAVLLENHGGAARQLRTNCQLLKADAKVHETDTLHWLANTAPQPFDLVFLDPPFAERLQNQVCQLLEAGHWLSPNAQIYIESPSSQPLVVPNNWQQTKEKVAGQVAYRLFQRG